MNWLRRQSNSIKIVLIGVASLIGLVGCFGERATPTPSPPEWLQPPEVVLGTQELQVEYVGRIPVAYKNPEPEQGIPEFIPGQVDVWEVSNPTANALAPYYVLHERDKDGFLLSSREWGICASRHGSLTQLYEEMFLIPPGESIIVAEGLTEKPEVAGKEFFSGKPIPTKEVAQNVTRELKIQTLEGCWFAEYFGIHYDPNVRLISVEQSEEALTLLVENAGSGDGGGLLYMNVYTQDGTPISGDLVGDIECRIPAGEKVKRTLEFRLNLPDKVFDTAPGKVRLEFVWLGISK